MNAGPGSYELRRRWRRRIFAITWFTYVAYYFTRSSFPVAKVAIGDDPSVRLTAAEMGLIDGSYLTAYALGQFLWGAMGDRCGPRTIVVTGLLLSIAAALGMSASTAVLGFLLFSGLQGLSQSTGWAPLTTTMGNWFALGERGTVMGWWATNYAIGSLVALPFAAWAVGYFQSWHYAFLAPAAVVAIVLPLFALLQRNHPREVGLSGNEPQSSDVPGSPSPSEAPRNTWRILSDVTRSPMVFLLGLVYFLLKPTRYAVLFWGPLYVSEKLGTSVAKSAAINVAFFLAGPVSVIAAGLVSDRVFHSRRVPVCVICLLLLAIVLCFFDRLSGWHNEWLVAAVLFAMGLLLFGPDSLISGTAAIDFGTGKGASTAVGLINGLGSVGAIVGGSIPGFIKDAWGWDGVFYFLAGCVTLAGVLLIPKWNAVPSGAK